MRTFSNIDQIKIKLLYLQERMSIRQIANKLNIPKTHIGQLIKSKGWSRDAVVARKMADAPFNKNANFGRNTFLTAEQREYKQRVANFRILHGLQK